MKMIFIDNDREERSKEDFEHVLDWMTLGGIDEDLFKDVEILSDFYHTERDERLELIQNSDVILTHSMLTAGTYNSRGQLMGMMIAVGRYDIMNKIYIDTGQHLIKTVSEFVRDGRLTGERIYAIQCAIENNYIISIEDDNDDEVQPQRLRLSFKGFYEDGVVGEPIDINTLIKQK